MIRRLSVVSLAVLAVSLVACGGTTTDSAATSAATSVSMATSTPVPTSTPAPAATRAITTVSPASTTTRSATPPASPAASPTRAAAAPTGASTFVIVPDQSEARFRAREQLAGHDASSDAIGRTKTLSGQVALDQSGAVVKDSSKVTVDLNSLKSDESRRDNFIKQNTIQTAQYPQAVFVPTQAQGLPWPLPTSGQATFKLLGDLTIHGVTKPSTWDVTATFTDQSVQGTATTSFNFEDFGMTRPRVALVLSVEDTVKLEFDFTTNRQG